VCHIDAYTTSRPGDLPQAKYEQSVLPGTFFKASMPRKNGKKAVEGVEGVEWGWITLDWAETMALKSGQRNVGLTLFLP